MCLVSARIADSINPAPCRTRSNATYGPCIDPAVDVAASGIVPFISLMIFLIVNSREYSSTQKDLTISRPWTVISLRKSSDSGNMTPPMPSRECVSPRIFEFFRGASPYDTGQINRRGDSPPVSPSLPHNKAGFPPRDDEEITSHDKPSGDDSQQDLLPMSLSKYRKDPHDIAKRCNQVLDKAIQKAKTRSGWHREVSKLCNQRVGKWKEALEVTAHDYDEANADALQIRSEADNIVSFISLAEKMPASIKPSSENMTSYRETLAYFEARHTGAVLFAETYKRSKEQISGELDKLSRRIKNEEEKVQEDSETVMAIEREQRHAKIIEQLVQIDGKDAMKLFEAHPRFFKDLEAMVKNSEGEAQH